MKTVTCLALVVLQTVAVARGAESYFDFAHSGETVDIEKKVKKATHYFKEVKVPINRVLDGQSFECSFHAAFPAWRHYAEIFAGVPGLEARFNMNDNRKRTVYLPGGSFALPKGNEFIIVLRYCSFTRSVSGLVKSPEGEVLHKTRWKKTFRKCPLSDFRVTARGPNKESDEFNAAITLDKNAGTIFARSKIGKHYFISADISDVGIKVMPDGFEDRLAGVK